MNYPVWFIPSVGGALVIALVAILHVVVAHFAVGGGLWLVLTEKKAYQEKKNFILEYVKKHALFFIMLTMVLGSMTGVGIWLTISIISPDATSLLIHSFIFAWAIEWVFFFIEIVTAFLYYYTFGKISKKTHLLVGWVYFITAWFSLFWINGILSFMLTPGKWLQTQNFWDGFFNPTFLPSTLFRTFLSFALAGSYAFLTATKKFRGEERTELVKYNGRWILYSVLGMIPSLIWYYFSLPGLARKGLAGSSEIMSLSFYHLVISMVVFLLLLAFFILWKSAKFTFSWALVILLSIFVFFGAFEFLREAGRKPYIIQKYMYPSGLKVSQIEELKGQSILKLSKWVQIQEINPDNELQAGEEIFRIECSACHSFGIKNNIVPAIRNWSENKVISLIGKLPGISPFMPPFLGTDQEKKALGRWLFSISRQEVSAEEVQPYSPILSGENIFSENCSDCHEIEGEEGIKNKLKRYRDFESILEILGKLEELSEDMPPFEGTEAEKQALARYLLKLKNGDNK
jgi:mono/diheme cytochrome c family protein